MLAIALLVLKDSHYQKILVWSAEHFLDSQLIVGSPIEVDVTRNLLFRSRDLQLIANDDSYRLSIANLHINFQLGSYLRTGTFLFNHLDLEGVRVDIKEMASDEFDSIDEFEIPPVAFSNLSVNKLVLSYQELSPGTLHTFSLEELGLQKSSEDRSTSVRAIGELKEEPFEMQGTLGSILKTQETSEPLPVNFEFSSADINAHVHGSIDDPLRGLGLNIDVKATIKKVSKFAEIFLHGVPELGALQLAFTIRGDYSGPSAEIVDFKLWRGQQVSLIASGSVADVINGTGLDLKLDGKSTDPVVLSWLLFKKQDQMQTLQFKGRLLGDVENLSLQAVEASAETTNHFKIRLSGDMDGWRAKRNLKRKDAKLKLQFSAPSLDAIPMIDVDTIPKIRSVAGSAMLAFSRDEIGVYASRIQAGKQNENQFLLAGDIGSITLADKPQITGLALKTDIELVSLAELNALVNYELPDIGPVQLHADLVSKDSSLQLYNTQLNVDTKSATLFNAKDDHSL